MSEIIKLNKEEGVWKIPNNGIVRDANLEDDISSDAILDEAKAVSKKGDDNILQLEPFQHEEDYSGSDIVVSGEVADNIVNFFEAKKKMARVAYNARKAA